MKTKEITNQPYEVFSTTADVGIRISGSNLEELFANGWRGVNQLLFEGQPGAILNLDSLKVSVKSRRLHRFRYEGDGPENLMVNFLGEIIFLFQERGHCTLEITFKTLTSRVIEVDLLLCTSTLPAVMEIKSVTYHNLIVVEREDRFFAEVIFDI